MITHCPVCRYSLEGLPEKHRCPECGFEYDKDSVLFPAPRVGWLAVAALNGAMVLFIVVMWWVKGAAGQLYLWAFVFLLPTVGHLLNYRKATGTAVLVSHDRVREIRGHVVSKTIHLDQIDRANWSFVDGGLRLYRLDGEVETIRTAANRAVARAIQARLTKRKQLTSPDVTPPSAQS